MTDPETIASLRRDLANYTQRALAATTQRDHFRTACRLAVDCLAGDDAEAEKVRKVLKGLQGALAGDSPDPWTYVTDDDASLPPVGERVLVWKDDQITPWDVGYWDGKNFDNDNWNRPVPRPYVIAYQRVTVPKGKPPHAT